VAAWTEEARNERRGKAPPKAALAAEREAEHLHSDHIIDLNDVITTHWIRSSGPAPLRVIGPPGTQQVVDGILAMLALDQEYRQAHHADLRHPMAVAVTEVGPGSVLSISGAVVVVGATEHRPAAPTVGYRIEYAGAAVASAGTAFPAPAWMSRAPAPTSTCRPSCGPI
jgi:hypothetical protein